MKFKKGKLYKVVKDRMSSYCVGCVLRYEGTNKLGGHHSKTVKKGGCGMSEGCVYQINRAINFPNDYKLVEYEGMIKFCKKLRKKLKND